MTTTHTAHDHRPASDSGATIRTTRRCAIGIAAAAAAGLVLGAPLATAVAAPDGGGDAAVIANRGSGDVSVIDADTLAVDTFDLPGEAEPMYVSHDPDNGRVLVGDRASSSIVVLDDESFDVVGSVPVGAGVFHQWLDPHRNQLWVVGDLDDTVTVVDGEDLTVITTIDLPADIVAAGGRPHDVFVDGNLAFVSIVGLAGADDAVIQYSTKTFTATGRIAVGKDPHLFVRAGILYVASQDAGRVVARVASTMRVLGSVEIDAAHGIWVTPTGEVLVTNIAGGGTDAVWDVDRLLDVDHTTDTAVAVPHNLAEVDGQVFVTHSGATNDSVSVIAHGRDGFGTSEVVTVGSNPFGLAVIDR
jgi:DNA-binding beta-propeller fold protein YncE